MNHTPWTASYPAGMRWDAPLALGPVDRLLDNAAERWPQRAAIDFMGREIGFAELHSLVARAARPAKAGRGPGRPQHAALAAAACQRRHRAALQAGLSRAS